MPILTWLTVCCITITLLLYINLNATTTTTTATKRNERHEFIWVVCNALDKFFVLIFYIVSMSRWYVVIILYCVFDWFIHIGSIHWSVAFRFFFFFDIAGLNFIYLKSWMRKIGPITNQSAFDLSSRLLWLFFFLCLFLTQLISWQQGAALFLSFLSLFLYKSHKFLNRTVRRQNCVIKKMFFFFFLSRFLLFKLYFIIKTSE